MDETISSHFNNNIGRNNKVNEKIILYLRNVSDQEYTNELNIGTIYLINCHSVIINNLTLEGNEHGVFIWGSSAIQLSSNIIRNNKYGILIKHSKTAFCH